VLKIVLDNSFGYIQEGCETQEFLSAYRALSVKDPKCFWSPLYRAKRWDGYVHFLDRKTRQFPVGLTRSLTTILDRFKVKYELEDLRVRPEANYHPINLTGIDVTKYPYEYQGQIIEECVVAGRGIVQAATNSGKTEIMAGLAQKLNVPTLIITHTINLLDQTIERLQNRLKERVGKIGAGTWAPRKLTVGMVQTLISRLRAEEEDAMEFISSIRAVMIDECHHASSRSWLDLILSCNNAYYKFGFSGTAIKDSLIQDMRLLGGTGELIHAITNKELIDRGISAVPTIRVKNIRDSTIPASGISWDQAYEMGIVTNKVRNAAILETVSNDLLGGKRVFVIVSRIRHGELLRGLFKRSGINAEFIWGNTDAETRERLLKHFKDKHENHRCIISSTICDEGVDVPAIDTLVIAAAGKCRTTLLQRVGRALRKKVGGENVCEIIDFVDFHNIYLLKHSKERLSVYRREGFKVIREANPDTSLLLKF
jgi:superfamily II DNA or RNA helicase